MSSSPPPAVEQDVPLGPSTTLQVGGPAKYFCNASSRNELANAFRWAREAGVEPFVLGGGSNVVVSEQGFDGLVVRPRFHELRAEQSGHRVRLRVDAGYDWDSLVEHCVEQDWAGIECLSGIPGHVGATPIQNVGAYGQEVAERIVEVEVFNRRTLACETLSHAQCHFGYRNSIFKSPRGAHWVVCSVTFELEVGGSCQSAYPGVLKELGQRLGLAEARQRVLELRASKSMVLDPGDENRRSCGSFFLNPILPLEVAQRMKSDSGEPPPLFPQGDAHAKLPAAWLIEQAGMKKGQRFGRVGLSSKHSLALICHEGATSHDVVRAAWRVRRAVRERFGVELHPEPRFLGFERLIAGLPPEA